MTIVLKNYCWLQTGFRPFKSEIAINYLIDNGYIDFDQSKKFKNILGKSKSETINKYNDIIGTVLNFTLEVQIKTKSAMHNKV